MLLLLLLLDLPFDIEVDLLGKEEANPTLLEVTSFLYDFNMGYELSRLATDSRYENFRFSNYSLFRNGRPLRNKDRLRIKHLKHSSPIDLQTILWGAPVAVGALWGVVQIVEKISNWKLNRRRLEEEIKKLERENLKAARGATEQRVPIYSEKEYLLQIQNREATYLIDGVTRRLEKSKVHIKEMNIRFVRRTRDIPLDED